MTNQKDICQDIDLSQQDFDATNTQAIETPMSKLFVRVRGGKTWSYEELNSVVF